MYLAKLYNEPLDEIIMSEVMYDSQRNISGETPEPMRFVREVAIPLFENWGYKVTIVRGEIDYLTFFNRVIERPRKHLENTGKCFGFPCGARCGIRRDCKVRPIEKYLKSLDGEIVQYCGICADETTRLCSMHKSGKVSLLEKYGVTQEETRELCLSQGLFSPSYEYSERGGCWMCPFAKQAEHEAIRAMDPKLWEEFVSLEQREDIANKRWNVFSETLYERNLRINVYANQ